MKNLLFILCLLPVALFSQATIAIQADGDSYRIVTTYESGDQFYSRPLTAQEIVKQISQRLINEQDEFYRNAGISYFSNARAVVLRADSIIDATLGTNNALFAAMRSELPAIPGLYRYNNIYFRLYTNGTLLQTNAKGVAINGGIKGRWVADSHLHIVLLNTGSDLDNLDFILDPFRSRTFRTSDKAHSITKIKQ